METQLTQVLAEDVERGEARTVRAAGSCLVGLARRSYENVHPVQHKSCGDTDKFGSDPIHLSLQI